MSDLIIVDGDTVTFLPAFGLATVTLPPVLNTTISASAATTKVGTKAPCLQGDENNVQLSGCSYVTSVFSVPGQCSLKIDKLNNDQVTQTTEIEGKKVILKGSTFDAVLEVAPGGGAKTSSTPPTVDATPKYSGGSGSFVPSNSVVFAA